MEFINAGDVRTGRRSFDEPGDLVTSLLQAAGFVRHRLGEFLERYELTEGRYLVLQALEASGSQGLSQSDVADQMMQSESNVSSLIERLHRDGLVDRRWSDTDRRKRVLLLTASGHQLFSHVEVARRRWAESLLSRMSSADRQAMATGLKNLHSKPASIEPAPRASAHTPVMDEAIGIEDRAWVETAAIGDPNSPHFALERMLSTLGLAGRFGGGEQ